MDNARILEDMGLPEQEAQAYLALLKLGGSLASAVAKEMGVKRTTVYAILKSLAGKGLALVYFRKNKRFYYPVQPHKLSALFEKKLEAFNNLIPTLQSMEKKQAQMMGLRFIETKEELKRFYTDINDEYKNLKNKEYYAISSDISWENIDKDFFIKYREDRANLGIKTRLLFSQDSRETVDTSPDLLRKYKFLPTTYTLTSSINIFHDRILIADIKLDSLAVVISIQPMVETFKAIFETLWQLIPEEKEVGEGATK